MRSGGKVAVNPKLLKAYATERQRLCREKTTGLAQRRSECSKVLYNNASRVWKKTRGVTQKRFFMALPYLSKKVAVMCSKWDIAFLYLLKP